jgi:hypothetical protein
MFTNSRLCNKMGISSSRAHHMCSSSSFRATANTWISGATRAVGPFCTSPCIPTCRPQMHEGRTEEEEEEEEEERRRRNHRRSSSLVRSFLQRRLRAVLGQHAVALSVVVALHSHRLAGMALTTLQQTTLQPEEEEKEEEEKEAWRRHPRAPPTLTLDRKDWRLGELSASIRPK